MPVLGCGHFRAVRLGFSLWHTCYVVRHGHYTLKQLRLPVLNEMHTNSCTSPRLLNVLWYGGATISLITFDKAKELNLIGESVKQSVVKVGGSIVEIQYHQFMQYH